MIKRPVCIGFLAVGFVLALLTSPALSQSDLEPPTNAIVNGMPVSTMKSLNQIEPRTLISQLPFSIMIPGSYYVSAPLFATNATNGITIFAGNVRLDLNGFPLIGNSNGIHGISIQPGCFNVVIRNGVISDWAGFGISGNTAPEMTIADIKSINNGWGGIYAGDNALIERCSVYGNGMGSTPPNDDGINAGPYSSITECKSRYNRGANIHTYQYSRVTGCTASESSMANGIWVEDYSIVKDCTASKNANHGIRVSSRCRAVENTCGENGFYPPGVTNTAAGILIEGQNSVAQWNICCGNYYGFLITNFPPNVVLSRGNLIINNVATKNGPGGDYQSPPPVNNFQGNIEQFAGQFTNANPWINFRPPPFP